MVAPNVTRPVLNEVLAASGAGVVASARDGELCVAGVPAGVRRVIGAAVSADADLVAAVTEEKTAVVLRRIAGGWEKVCEHSLPKRPSAVCFSSDASSVLVPDGFGDLYKLPVTVSCNVCDDETDQDDLRILGHFSTITDLAQRHHYIATADRDDKIRISRFPDSFVIEVFCLGHTDFVTCVRWVSDDRVLSGAGDGTVRLWNSQNGALLSTLEVHPLTSSDGTEPKAVVLALRPHPQHPDLAIVVIHAHTALLVVAGIQDDGPLRIASQAPLPEGSTCTGADIDSMGVLWVSTVANGRAVFRYRVGKDGAVVGDGEPLVIQLPGAVAGTAAGDAGSDGKPGAPHARTVGRSEWLPMQRKKEMVENWKGKKRRHVELE